jgi:hypothetical protein
MDAKTKFKLKRQIKLFFTLAWGMVGFFLLYVTVIGFSGKLFGKPLASVFGDIFGTTFNSPIVLITALTLLVVPLFGGLMFTMLSQSCRQQLYSYKNGIHQYRARKFFITIMKLIEAGEINKAVDLYRVVHMPEKVLDDMLYCILITECKYADDDKLKVVGQTKTNKLKEVFDPAKIKF